MCIAAAGRDNTNGVSQMLPLHGLAPHKQPESRPLVWLRDPAQPTRELGYMGATVDSESSKAVGAREPSVVLRISLAPEGVVVRSREDTERRLSLVGRANLRRWRALELLRLTPNYQDMIATISSGQAFGEDIPPMDSELLLRPLRIGECSQYKSCGECLGAGRRAATSVATNRGGSDGVDASYQLGCGWCAGRRRQCVPDLRGMCRNEETHLRNASQCERQGP
jgi:hypothetical protein